MDSRRTFLLKSVAAMALTSRTRSARAETQSRTSQASRTVVESTTPWFRRTMRWMQTNIAELDATRYDIPFWRAHWARTRTQGIVVNAGGIVAYYPTQVPFHRRAEFLGERDLF